MDTLTFHPGTLGFNALICPECGESCGHLYQDEDSPEGACLGCKLDWNAVAEYERTEEDAFHDAAEARYAVCGID